MDNIGFTGTRRGMTPAQHATLTELLALGLPLTRGARGEFHHGLCVGADDEASWVAHRLGWATVGHPGYGKHSTDPPLHGHAREVTTPHPYLVRNHHIVDDTDMLIACPRGPQVVRSGTWATVRYAHKRGRRIFIVTPDGTLERFAA